MATNKHIRRKDWTGQKFHMLTMVRPTSKRGSGQTVIWEALCECGNTALVVPNQVKSGQVKSCGCWYKQTRKTSARRYNPIISSARNIWRGVYQKRDSALDFETFYALSQQDCYYCGAPPSNQTNIASGKAKGVGRSLYQKARGSFIYNGIDRVDNTRGYTKDNIVPCCKRCNVAKNNMSLQEFLTWIERLYHHSRSISPPSFCAE